MDAKAAKWIFAGLFFVALAITWHSVGPMIIKRDEPAPTGAYQMVVQTDGVYILHTSSGHLWLRQGQTFADLGGVEDPAGLIAWDLANRPGSEDLRARIRVMQITPPNPQTKEKRSTTGE